MLAVTGNISWEETVRLTEKWFAPIPRRNVPVRQLPQEVVQTAERRQTVERNVPLDALFMAYHMCSREDADYYAFDILSDILSNGRSSRLTRRLVQEQKFFPVSMPISPVHGMPACCISVETICRRIFGTSRGCCPERVGRVEIRVCWRAGIGESKEQV